MKFGFPYRQKEYCYSFKGNHALTARAYFGQKHGLAVVYNYVLSWDA